jgi:hypothetical protein
MTAGGGYYTKADETGLFWKQLHQLSSSTFISTEEKIIPGFKAVKDHCLLLLGHNTFRDYNLWPLMVYH